ncbi:MAG TPA: Gfo/Idh/MocA family oxidoreductase, partial [Planctomycetia bacterium]|nr:Gfo/Idh/MocA family oxidoreductase [Planctomycetia bacterium]
FGGGLFTDLMVHWLDVVHWFCEVETPTLALSFGDWIHAKGHWETPDTVQTLLHYPGTDKRSLLQVHYEGTFSNAHRAAMTTFMGSEATLYVDRGRFEFIPERGKTGAVTKVIANNPKSRGADFYDQPDGERLHLENWLDCIRTRKETTAPLKAGLSAALAAQLANMALRGKGMAMHAPT